MFFPTCHFYNCYLVFSYTNRNRLNIHVCSCLSKAFRMGQRQMWAIYEQTLSCQRGNREKRYEWSEGPSGRFILALCSTFAIIRFLQQLRVTQTLPPASHSSKI